MEQVSSILKFELKYFFKTHIIIFIVSILIFVIISVLVVFEFLYYTEKEIHYKYNVDFDHDRQVVLIFSFNLIDFLNFFKIVK